MKVLVKALILYQCYITLEMDKAIVLFSGGIDSTTSLYWAKERYDVYALTINHYNRNYKEIDSTHKIALRSNTPLIEVNLDFIKDVSDINKEHKYDDLRWSYYIPSKNLLFYSIAAHYAEYMRVKAIIGGHHKEDRFYRDARVEYIELLNTLLKEGSMLYNEYEIIIPFVYLTKLDVVRLGYKLNIPFELTWSCHKIGKKHCGKCYGCLRRIDTFNKLDINDSVEYER